MLVNKIARLTGFLAGTGAAREDWDRVEEDRSMADNVGHDQRLRLKLQNMVKRLIEMELTQIRAEENRQATQPDSRLTLFLDWHLGSGRAS
ncbi:MAG: hypothetical protein ABRQ23_00495 [Syntrophomonadaceae bacterium]